MFSLRTATINRFFSASSTRYSFAQVKKPAPHFAAASLRPDGTFGTCQLSDYKDQWLVLFFYPLDFTFVCPTEIIAYSERCIEFQKLGAQVVGCSVDSVHSHLAWTKQSRKEGGLGSMKIPLLADITKSISKSYGVLLENEGIALRGTFIIDPKGILRQSTINDLPVGRNVDETLRLVEALQWADKNGEVCPVGWKKGDITINTKEASKYFSNVNK